MQCIAVFKLVLKPGENVWACGRISSCILLRSRPVGRKSRLMRPKRSGLLSALLHEERTSFAGRVKDVVCVLIEQISDLLFTYTTFITLPVSRLDHLSCARIYCIFNPARKYNLKHIEIIFNAIHRIVRISFKAERSGAL